MDNDDILYRLINEEIDGTISSQDLQTLKKMLVESDEARRIYERIKGAADIYKGTAPIEPPSDLKDNIMRIIDAGRYSPSRKKSLFDTIRARLYGFKAGYAWSFAGGVVVGALILALCFGIFKGSLGLNEKELTGTIVSGSLNIGLNIIKKESFGDGAVGGTFEAVQSGNTIRTRLEIRAKIPVTMSVKFDHRHMKLMEFLKVPDGLEVAQIGTDEIEIKNNNDGEYTIIFEKKTGGKSTIDFLLASDTVIYVSSLAID